MTVHVPECFWKSANKQQQQSITHTSTNRGQPFLNTFVSESLPIPELHSYFSNPYRRSALSALLKETVTYKPTFPFINMAYVLLYV